MKKIILTVLAFATVLIVHAQKWNLDKNHAKLGFTVSHLVISDVDGEFKNFDASIVSKSATDFTDAVFTVTAQINSVSTDNEKRDADLNSPRFFDAVKYPVLSFTSTSVKKVSGSNYVITGNLTMHGITKSVTLNAVINTAQNPMSKKTFAAVKVTGKLNRSDFGIGSSIPTSIVGDEITIDGKAEFGLQ